jgi:TRAP-type C4-dicarboxylate transport system permease small subunit
MTNMHQIERFLERRLWAIRKVAKLAIVVIFGLQVVVVFSQVVWRFVFNNPFSWSEELARYLQVWLILITSAVCIRKGRHLAIDYISHRVSFRVQRFFKLTWLVGIMGYLLVVIVFGIQMITVTGGQTTPALQVPIGLVYLAFPITGIFMLLETFIVLARVINARTTDDLSCLSTVID